LVRIFSTGNCAKLAELRRGVDHASIYSVSFSPSGQLLAVTSDKSTLHIFDVPHPNKPPRAESPNVSPNRRLTSMSGGSPTLTDADVSQKWGILGKIPLMPRVFSDIYSFASVRFEIGEESFYAGATPMVINGDSGFQAPKGIIGWTSDEVIIIIGAGRDARWEKFVITEGEDGRRYCVRDGWKRYLGAS